MYRTHTCGCLRACNVNETVTLAGWVQKIRNLGAMTFIENDARTLLQRLPENVKAEHYHDDEVHIRALLEEGGLIPPGGMALAAATVRGLILTVSHQEQIGALYPQVLETLVRGACRELFRTH